MPLPFEQPVTITRPFLPPLENYRQGLEGIWNCAWITNHGPVLQEFERKLSAQLATKQLSLFVNGTQALQAGLAVMQVKGEVVTTPFSFVATAHALRWNQCTPVFVDIDPVTFNLEPTAVEAAITPRTSAILAVHVFGHPCNVDALAEIARRHQLPLIFDAAHATKVFHAIEGGLLIFKDPALQEKLDQYKDFGFSNEFQVERPGTNAKMNEFQALMGLLVMDHLQAIIEKRKQIDAVYRSQLTAIPGLTLPPEPATETHHNYCYFPIQLDSDIAGIGADEVTERMKQFNVFARPYFHPLIPDLDAYRHLEQKHPLTTARGVSERILALPLHADLSVEDAHRVAEIVRFALGLA